MEFLETLFSLHARLGIPLDSGTAAKYEYAKKLYDELAPERAELAHLGNKQRGPTPYDRQADVRETVYRAKIA